MIRKSTAHSNTGSDKPLVPPMNANIEFEEVCALCDKEIPNGRLVLRHTTTGNILCIFCIVDIAAIE